MHECGATMRDCGATMQECEAAMQNQGPPARCSARRGCVFVVDRHVCSGGITLLAMTYPFPCGEEPALRRPDLMLPKWAGVRSRGGLIVPKSLVFLWLRCPFPAGEGVNAPLRNGEGLGWGHGGKRPLDKHTPVSPLTRGDV
jgi:hypothetical protein